MAITTLDGIIAASKQRLQYVKTASRTSIAATYFSLFDLAGSPGAGTLAIGNTANGVVPTDATAGYQAVDSFGGGNTGYIASVEFSNTVASRLILADTLFSAGAYAFNAATSLTTQPSYTGRLPGTTDYNNTEIWIEAVTAFTGNLSVAVTYTNQAGTTARTTGTVATGVAPTLGRMIQLPLQAGDIGVRTIESVTATVATVGTFNVHVLRRLWQGRVAVANSGDIHDFLKTGMVQIFDTSALRLIVAADSTATGIPEAYINIING